MADIWSALLSLAGGLVTTGINSASSKKSYQRQLELQRQQQAWLEYMSNTAHQREVKDLRAAGLNPILSATGGSGASSGSSTGGSVSTPTASDLSALGDVLNGAENASANKTSAKASKQNADVNQQNADTQERAQASQDAVNQSQIDLNNANKALATAKAQKELATMPAYNVGNKILKAGEKTFNLNLWSDAINGLKPVNSGATSKSAENYLQSVLRRADMGLPIVTKNEAVRTAYELRRMENKHANDPAPKIDLKGAKTYKYDYDKERREFHFRKYQHLFKKKGN